MQVIYLYAQADDGDFDLIVVADNVAEAWHLWRNHYGILEQEDLVEFEFKYQVVLDFDPLYAWTNNGRASVDTSRAIDWELRP